MDRLIAIGDIHGHYEKLVRLVDKIQPLQEDRIIFLGDYIDRGPASYQVVEYIINFKTNFKKTVTLMGNHEEYVINRMNKKCDEHTDILWRVFDGGRATLNSYEKFNKIFENHLNFYSNLLISFETDEYFFCHAGIRPGTPLKNQNKQDLINIRDDFFESDEMFEKIIVHGHTITKNEKPEILNNRINIDTGCAYKGPLTAIQIPEMIIWQESGDTSPPKCPKCLGDHKISFLNISIEPAVCGTCKSRVHTCDQCGSISAVESLGQGYNCTNCFECGDVDCWGGLSL